MPMTAMMTITIMIITTATIIRQLSKEKYLTKRGSIMAQVKDMPEIFSWQLWSIRPSKPYWWQNVKMMLLSLTEPRVSLTKFWKTSQQICQVLTLCLEQRTAPTALSKPWGKLSKQLKTVTAASRQNRKRRQKLRLKRNAKQRQNAKQILEIATAFILMVPIPSLLCVNRMRIRILKLTICQWPFISKMTKLQQSQTLSVMAINPMKAISNVQQKVLQNCRGL